MGRCGEADPLQSVFGALFEPFDCEGEVGASFAFAEGVDLVDDDDARVEAIDPASLREEGAEGLGGGEEQVGSTALLVASFARVSVSGADLHSYAAIERERRVDGCKRGFEVAMDVAVQRFERGDVDGAHSVREPGFRLGFMGEFGEDGEEGGQSLAAASGREDQDIVPL